MKVLFFDCGMGAAGDMMTASLYELLSDEEKTAFLKKVNSLGIEGTEVKAQKSVKCGITGTHMQVLVDGREEGHNHEENHGHEHYEHEHHEHDHGHDHEHHHHSSLSDIGSLIDSMDLSDKAAEDAKNVYRIIAEAESRVHGEAVEQIHFHEVGTKDAVIDVVSVCILIDMLKPDRILSSPVHTGYGSVRCMHGILPVPAPAAAHILEGVPICAGKIEGELTTPTGAALLKYFVSEFMEMPVMKVDKTGYGMGTKDFKKANCLRAFLGESEADEDETVAVLMCNVDDMTGEDIGFACERFFEGGASEVFTVPVNMKKSRPGHLIEVICSNEKAESMIRLMFKYTTTIGIRRFEYKRYILERRKETVKTPLGDVQLKVSEGYGVKRTKYEYEDLARIASENNMSLNEVREYIRKNES